LKKNPSIKKNLEGDERIYYGDRDLIKGGLQSLTKMSFQGGMLIGENDGTLNYTKNKGSHTAMKSGIIAGEHIFQDLHN
jgi:electron-transferring-flavoprotein dehydrogenase